MIFTPLLIAGVPYKAGSFDLDRGKACSLSFTDRDAHFVSARVVSMFYMYFLWRIKAHNLRFTEAKGSTRNRCNEWGRAGYTECNWHSLRVWENGDTSPTFRREKPKMNILKQSTMVPLSFFIYYFLKKPWSSASKSQSSSPSAKHTVRSSLRYHCYRR